MSVCVDRYQLVLLGVGSVGLFPIVLASFCLVIKPVCARRSVSKCTGVCEVTVSWKEVMINVHV